MINLYKTMRLQTAKPTREARIYGVEYDYTQKNFVWRRTDAAVGKSVAISVGSKAGHSDFDTCYPWSAMKRVTLPTGDVMVKIPEFYYQRTREGTIERIKIADRPTEGFEKHPGSGGYISAYALDWEYMSRKGGDIAGAQSHPELLYKQRDKVEAKGDGWSWIGYKEYNALVFLTLVEFATHKVNEIFPLYEGGSLDEQGQADDVPNLTGITEDEDISVYRGIEGCFLGIGWSVRLDASYADDVTTFAIDGITTSVTHLQGEKDLLVKNLSYIDGHTWIMLPAELTNEKEGYYDSWVPAYYTNCRFIDTGGGAEDAGSRMFGTLGFRGARIHSIYREKEA